MNRVVLLALISTLSAAPVWAEHFNGHVDVNVGALSSRAAAGQQVFNKECGSCHGLNGAGTREGPPLIHDIYNPGHHGNRSFSSAVTRGVQQHHWPYGNMPAQPDVGFSDMAGIVAFIREVQKHNGIVKKAHKM
ncbi:MAG: mono/diheme cytochrome c family protein [Motiliproteus sp.]|jgi:mono/diheme cytochrome c family protein